MVFKVALRSWCKRRGINHRDFSDDELIEMRIKSKEEGYNLKFVNKRLKRLQGGETK